MASQKPLQEGELYAQNDVRALVLTMPPHHTLWPLGTPIPKKRSRESWVELQMQQNTGAGSEPTIETPQASIYNGNLEKLLIEAQRESRSTSYANSKESSARGSPKSPHSPNADWATGDGRMRQDPGSDWIWDWSSGPEIQPSNEWSEKFRHPAGKQRRLPLNVSKSPMTKPGIFRLENLPALLLSHACSFFLGAAVVFFYLKKYCNLSAVVPSTLD